jgi:hypothetical protein
MDVSLFSLIKSTDPGFYYLMVVIMILVVLTFVVSIYAAVRTDKLWSLIKRQHDIAEIKKEVSMDLRTKSGA